MQSNDLPEMTSNSKLLLSYKHLLLIKKIIKSKLPFKTYISENNANKSYHLVAKGIVIVYWCL